MAAVGLVLVVAAVTIVVGRRRALPPAPPVPELPPEPSAEPAEAGRRWPSVAVEPDVVPLETPEPPASRLSRLRRRLSASNNPFARGLLGLLAADRLDAEAWEDLEATLITSDLGVGPTDELITALRRETAIDGVVRPGQGPRRAACRTAEADRHRRRPRRCNVAGADGVPGVILVVGVNGTGKTTTIGKLARVLVAEGNSVLLAAADTFRAAAADQLQTWGARVGVACRPRTRRRRPGIRRPRRGRAGIEEGVDVVVVDTAGRLHTKTGLMDELGKIKRVIDRLAPVTEVLLVIDATTGQNGLAQARVFAEVVDVTGIVLSKLDGSAKGGIVVPVQRELGVPVKLIGLGEGADDLAPFEPEGFVDALLGES